MRRIAVTVASLLALASFSASAQTGESVIGWWSRLAPGKKGYVREVLEFKSDGHYFRGEGFTTSPNGNLAGPPTVVERGSYSFDGRILILNANADSLGDSRFQVTVTRDRPDTGGGGLPPLRTMRFSDAKADGVNFLEIRNPLPWR